MGDTLQRDSAGKPTWMRGEKICAAQRDARASACRRIGPGYSAVGGPKKPFHFSTLGQLAAIGRRTGVANVFGVRFSGFVAWWLWRGVYLMKLPAHAKKLRVAIKWSFDLLFPREAVERTQPRQEPRQLHKALRIGAAAGLRPEPHSALGASGPLGNLGE